MCIGLDALQIHPGLPFASEEGKGRIDKVFELCHNYCVGKTNIRFMNATNFMSEHKNPQKQLTPMHLHFAHWLILVPLDPYRKK